MQDKLKNKWTKALRSGDYNQGHGILRDLDETYCCLGVLLDVSEVGKWRDAFTDNYLYEVECDNRVIQDELDLSSEVLNVLGLDHSAQRQLVNLNDDDGANFNEIADWIEENV